MKTPFLGLIMIVKNESHIICEVLESIVPFIDTFVISDTGSTDNTVEVILNFFKKHDITGHIIHNDWVDFGTNRTYALQHAYDKMQFGFVMDADDLLMTSIKTKSEFQNLLNKSYDGFKIKITDNDDKMFYWRLQIFNMKKKWIYEGVLHEYPTIKNKFVKNIGELDIKINSRRLGDRNKMDPIEKYKKDAMVLKNALDKDPMNVRYMFYLAQSYRDCRMFENSVDWYQKRADFGGWYEEVFFSLYQIGRMYLFELKDENKGIHYCIKAFKFHSKRTESINILVLYYTNDKRYEIAYPYSLKIKDIEMPKDDGLFLESEYYNFKTRFNHILLSLLNSKEIEQPDFSIYPLEYHPTIRDVLLLSKVPVLIGSGTLVKFPKDLVPTNPNPKETRHKYYRVFNPSVAKNDKDEIWINVRCTNFNDHYWSMDKNEIVNTENFLCTIDLSKIYKMHDDSNFKLINYARVRGYEDIRLFFYNHHWCFLANNDEIPNKSQKPQMVFGRLASEPHSDNQWNIEYVVLLQYPYQKECEKNWVPLVTNSGELQIVYSTHPLIILKPDVSTGFCEIILEKNWKVNLTFPYFPATIRNSSPYISFDNGWLSLCHVVYFIKEFNHQRVYYSVFVYFSNDFKHVKYSNIFHIEKTIIEFINGIIVVPNTDEDVMISYSLNDSIPKHHVFTKQFILEQLNYSHQNTT